MTGSFPHPLGPGGSFTLPNAWPDLANALADDSDSNPDNDAQRWDIHDDLTKFSKHVPGYCTTEVDPIRRRRTPWTTATPGSTVRWTVLARLRRLRRGDPWMARSTRCVLNTLLSDGRLNAGDAPMPAARVDVRSPANKGGTDLGGVGSLAPANKSVVYSRNRPVPHSAPQFLRAVLRGVHPGNVTRPGFLRASTARRRGTTSAGSWSTVSTTYWDVRGGAPRDAVPADTNCLRRGRAAGVPADPGGPAERGRLHG